MKNKRFKGFLCVYFTFIAIGVFLQPAFAASGNDKSEYKTEINAAIGYVQDFNFESLDLAIIDLTGMFGERYPKGGQYLERLEGLKELSKDTFVHLKKDRDLAKAGLLKLAEDLEKLQCEALLSNPLLDFEKLLLLKRRRGQLGLPVNHKCNSGIKRTGYDNEIAVLLPVGTDGRLQTLFQPSSGQFVGEMDLHFDADRLLFTMPK